MGGIVDGLFGGSSKKAAQMQVQSTEKAMQEYRQSTAQAKTDIAGYADSATKARLDRLQQAQDTIKTLFAPMNQAFTQGNMNAQQMLAGTAQQQQAALLGQAVDYSGLKPQGLNMDIMGLLAGLQNIKPAADQNTVPAANLIPPTTNTPPQMQMNPAAMLGGSNIGAGFRYDPIRPVQWR